MGTRALPIESRHCELPPRLQATDSTVLLPMRIASKAVSRMIKSTRASQGIADVRVDIASQHAQSDRSRATVTSRPFRPSAQFMPCTDLQWQAGPQRAEPESTMHTNLDPLQQFAVRPSESFVVVAPRKPGWDVADGQLLKSRLWYLQRNTKIFQEAAVRGPGAIAGPASGNGAQRAARVVDTSCHRCPWLGICSCS